MGGVDGQGHIADGDAVFGIFEGLDGLGGSGDAAKRQGRDQGKEKSFHAGCQIE